MAAEKKTTDMYAIVRHERRMIIMWSMYHLICICCLLLGLFFAYQYMTMPDRVIIIGREQTVFLGNSAPVESGRVIRDIAFRAAYALLSRRYDICNERALAFVFTKRGQGQARGYLNDTRDMFEKRQAYQEIESCRADYSLVNGYYHALVKGVLLRSGVYFGHPYFYRRDFALMMRLERSAADCELPFKVAGMRYWEEEQRHE